MQVHVPDPASVRLARARTHFRLALRIALGFVGILWLLHLSSWALGLDSGHFGIRPRRLEGLAGIVFAPLTHADFGHLLANSPPLVVLVTVMLTLYPQSAIRVLPAVYGLTGIAVWLFARDASHLGASGLVYGLASYVFAAGMLRRDRRAIAASLLVCFLYGALVWGLVPIAPRMSWETHLAAALVGVVMAVALRGLDAVPRKRYSWENESGTVDEANPAAAAEPAVDVDGAEEDLRERA